MPVNFMLFPRCSVLNFNNITHVKSTIVCINSSRLYRQYNLHVHPETNCTTVLAGFTFYGFGVHNFLLHSVFSQKHKTGGTCLIYGRSETHLIDLQHSLKNHLTI